MSRIGIKPVIIPAGVKASIDKNLVHVEGPKGKLQFAKSPLIQVAIETDKIKVSRGSNAKNVRALHGLTRAMIANMVKGVLEGYSRQLEMIGVGYRAQISGKKLILQLGFSHPVECLISEGITIETPKPTQIVVKGIDRQKVGQAAANIRGFLPPEPYKGKGIRYVGEYVRRKAGKAVAK
ncbi:MAG: 50S ribosomal protein L6 [Candidatus Omnitrophica bacterium]|nr:50S ribosomal protein L6 [Candidatus Omnitrophota bacterium]MBU1924846.1 50S ribosomal protein L6 [Candidatus Omnitrophota bacterium]